MAKDLKYFMREQKEEIVTVPGPESFVDENGQRVMMELRVLSSAEIRKISDAYKKRSIALDKKGAPYISNGEVVFKTENDSARVVRHLIAEALKYPNLKDDKLMAFYKCNDISEMTDYVFPRADEFAHVSRVVFAALGMAIGASDDETLEAAKN